MACSSQQCLAARHREPQEADGERFAQLVDQKNKRDKKIHGIGKTIIEMLDLNSELQ